MRRRPTSFDTGAASPALQSTLAAVLIGRGHFARRLPLQRCCRAGLRTPPRAALRLAAKGFYIAPGMDADFALVDIAAYAILRSLRKPVPAPRIQPVRRRIVPWPGLPPPCCAAKRFFTMAKLWPEIVAGSCDRGQSTMHHLGQTRSATAPTIMLQTPDTFVAPPLPSMVKATAVVHVGPALRREVHRNTRRNLRRAARWVRRRGSASPYVLERRS